jgi:hypothetical protein
MRGRDRALTRGLALASLVLAGPLGAGCGAKTGLHEPDGGVVDAFVPEEMDAGAPTRCIEVPPDGGPVTAAFTVPVSLAVVDVFFLIDATASMVDEIDNVRSGLRTSVVPGVRAAIPDAAFGVALVGEFPVEPFGPRDVSPYEMRSLITRDLLQIEGALDEVPSWGNFDDPEAQVEGLYQVATGEGLGEFIPPSFGCPGGGSGGACFRGESLPVIVLITDAPFHNGPGESEMYRGISPPPHSFEEAVDALVERGIFVIGLGARDVGRPSPLGDLRAIAEATGAVDEAGNVLAFDIGSRGDGVDDGIVRAIERLAAGLPLDVDAVVEDSPGDAIDARMLVTEVRPREADPADGIAGIEGDTFLGVVPGTRVTFEIVVDASGLPPSESTRRIPARIIFRAFGRSRVGREDIVIVIPGADGGGCMEGS